MANYLELSNAAIDETMLKRVAVAITVAAEALITAGPTAAQRKWLKVALYEPRGEATKAWRYILAANKSITIAQINAVTDAQIQTQVDTVVPTLISAINNA